MDNQPQQSLKEDSIYLVGNPNVGKSVLFGALTNKYVTVSNYPGTTVEVTHGIINMPLSGVSLPVVDTPGIQSLVPLSEDEEVTRDILLEHINKTGKMPRVVLVIDARNLRRGLLLAMQLSFAGIPYVVALNMIDEATAAGVQVDHARLEALLGVPVVPTIAIQKEGIARLLNFFKQPFAASHLHVNFSSEIEKTLNDLETRAQTSKLESLALLYQNESIIDKLKESQIKEAEQVLAENKISPNKLQIDFFNNVNKILGEVYTRNVPARSKFLNILGRLSIKPLTGFPILAGILFMAWYFVGNFGAGSMVDFVESVVFNEYINPAVIETFDTLLPFHHEHVIEEGLITTAYSIHDDSANPLYIFIHDLFVGEYGLITIGLTYAIAIILPIVLTFFLVFSFLEDSGYMPRMGSLLNTFFRTMGLNGKAILPMVMGLGCDTMATMTARVLDSRKERVIVTLLLALGVPCSAQLGVIFALGAALPIGYMIAWALSIVLVLFVVGFLSSKILPGQTSMFLMELPPLRRPSGYNILMKTYIRTKWYLKEAVPLFLIGTFILFLMDRFALIESMNNALEPLTVNLLGLPAETAQGFVMGFLRRDFGAAGFLKLHNEGLMTNHQTLVSLLVITLFIPCIANFLMIIKERGIKTGVYMFMFIVPFAIFVGIVAHQLMKLLGV